MSKLDDIPSAISNEEKAFRLSHDVLFKVVCNLIHECSGKLYIALKQFFTQSVMRTMESQNPGSSVEDIEAFYY